MRWTIGLSSPVTLTVAVALSLALAVVSYCLLESPIRTDSSLRRVSPPIKIGVGVAIAWAALMGISKAFDHQSSLSLSVTRDRQVWEPSAWTPSPPLSKQLGSGKGPRQTFAGRKIFVTGNSHAGAYAGVLSRMQFATGLNYSIFFNIRCSMGSMTPLRQIAGCAAVEDQFLEQLKREAKPGDLVFFASLRTPRFRDQWTELESDSSVLAATKTPLAIEQRRLGRLETEVLIERIKAMGLRVMIDLPKPIFKTPAFRCADWFNRSNPVCAAGFENDQRLLLELREPIVSEIREIQNRHPDLIIWDPFFRLCPSSPCHLFSNGKPLFFDGDHLSGYGNAVLYHDFLKALGKVWPEALQAQ